MMQSAGPNQGFADAGKADPFPCSPERCSQKEENLPPAALANNVISIKNICSKLLRHSEAQWSCGSMICKPERKVTETTLECEAGE